MKQHDLQPAPGSTRARKRVGRGTGSGHGTFSGRGAKGQKARTGGRLHPRFEGGQLPLFRRLPFKRGFTNIFKTKYAVVNLERLQDFPAGAEVNPEILAVAGIIKKTEQPVKILGQGELHVPLIVKAHKFSASAKAKIEAAGGTAVELGVPVALSGQAAADNGHTDAQ
jgi:large subunit ribosomal protein L15